MMREIEFYVEGSDHPKPTSARTVYVDGTAGNGFRQGMDVELSHWRPNQTEERYRAGTSTEICFKYLHYNKDINYDLVINNHLDVDGVLSVFTLTHPTVALRHKDVVIGAAEAGDFWAWSEGKALKLFQLLSLLSEKLEALNINLKESYQRCFALILRILQNQNTKSQAEKILLQQYSLIEEGTIIREELNQRLVSYHVPKNTVQGNSEKYLRTAKFNEPISERLAFWPQVRNRRDAQKLHLVSVEEKNCVHYELWIPGYCWADTKGLWQPPGLIPTKSMGQASQLCWENLSKIVAELNAQEQDGGHWNLFPSFKFGNTLNPRDFPIILSTVNRNDLQIGSRLPLGLVKDAFKGLV
jgi:hypothetical protein